MSWPARSIGLEAAVIRRLLVALAVLACLATPSFAGKGGGGKGASKGTKTSHATKAPKAPKTAKIHRSAAAKHQFEKESGYPKGRPGYVVDHIVPLACGGADAPINMQWQAGADAKAKDKIERKGCR
jgi:hypothetical protein